MHVKGNLARAGLCLVAVVVCACGASTPEPDSPEPRPDPEVAPPPEPAETSAEVGEGGRAADEEEAAAVAEDDQPPVAEPEPEPAPDEDAPRDVVYRITPEGLIIDVQGARFKPSAKLRKLDNGGYGIDIEVTAESSDDRTHTLLNPENGPLSMAATIYDKKGEIARRHGDYRRGKEEQAIVPGSPLHLSRRWPSGSVKGPVWWGERVRLEVGLWGLGVGGDRQRPLRKLFVIEMHGKGTAKPVISPPEVKR
jgi:hypothetical protein